MKSLILLTAATIVLAASTPKNHSIFDQNKSNVGIINGNETNHHSIPYQVLLQSVNSDSSEAMACSGTLISQKYILTSARCVSGISQLEVILGADRLDVPDFTATSMLMYGPQITIHENFHMNPYEIENDIAVVKLPANFDITVAIQVVKLPSRADIDNDYVGKTARISGWGQTSTNQSYHYIARTLMQADVQVISHEACEEILYILRGSVLCSTGKNGNEACNGDFGGPLVVDGVQIGITSFTDGNCRPEYPTVFTNIGSYLDWIENHTDVVIQ